MRNDAALLTEPPDILTLTATREVTVPCFCHADVHIYKEWKCSVRKTSMVYFLYRIINPFSLQGYLISCVWNCYRYINGRNNSDVLVYITTNDTAVRMLDGKHLCNVMHLKALFYISNSLVNCLNSFDSHHLLVMFGLEIQGTGMQWLQITSVAKRLGLFYAYYLLKNLC